MEASMCEGTETMGHCKLRHIVYGNSGEYLMQEVKWEKQRGARFEG